MPVTRTTPATPIPDSPPSRRPDSLPNNAQSRRAKISAGSAVSAPVQIAKSANRFVTTGSDRLVLDRDEFVLAHNSSEGHRNRDAEIRTILRCEIQAARPVRDPGRGVGRRRSSSPRARPPVAPWRPSELHHRTQEPPKRQTEPRARPQPSWRAEAPVRTLRSSDGEHILGEREGR